MKGIKRLKMLAAVMALGAAPLATVSSCDYGPGGGTFFLDQGVEDFFFPGSGFVVEDVFYEEEVYFYDEYDYDDYEDGFFADVFGWF